MWKAPGVRRRGPNQWKNMNMIAKKKKEVYMCNQKKILTLLSLPLAWHSSIYGSRFSASATVETMKLAGLSTALPTCSLDSSSVYSMHQSQSLPPPLPRSFFLPFPPPPPYAPCRKKKRKKQTNTHLMTLHMGAKSHAQLPTHVEHGLAIPRHYCTVEDGGGGGHRG